MMMINVIAAVPQVKAGKLRGLAVTTLKRSSALPSVPTVAESGLAGFEVTSWHGVFVPQKTPKAIVSRLNSTLVKIVHLPDMKEKLEPQGLEPVGSTPEALNAYIKEETAKYAKLIKQIGLKPE
jgi:tripartite-type tricarboxylate transporter receptor subunit TctC